MKNIVFCNRVQSWEMNVAKSIPFPSINNSCPCEPTSVLDRNGAKSTIISLKSGQTEPSAVSSFWVRHASLDGVGAEEGGAVPGASTRPLMARVPRLPLILSVGLSWVSCTLPTTGPISRRSLVSAATPRALWMLPSESCTVPAQKHLVCYIHYD